MEIDYSKEKLLLRNIFFKVKVKYNEGITYWFFKFGGFLKNNLAL